MANATGKSSKLFLISGIALILTLFIPLCKQLLRERQQRITYETFCVKNPKDLTNLELVYSLTNHCPDWKHDAKVWTELLTREDNEVDLLLRRFFEEMQQPKNWGGSRLDSFAGKRPTSNAERVLGAIGARHSKESVQYLLSLTNSPYVVIRGSIARAFTGMANFGEKPRNEEALWKLIPLLHDPDPDVAEITIYSLARIDSFRESQLFLGELLKAERAMVPTAMLYSFNEPSKGRLHQEVDDIYRIFQRAAEEHQAKADHESKFGREDSAKREEQDLARANSLLHFINENRKFKTVNSNDLIQMPNDQLNGIYQELKTNGAAWHYDSYALVTNEVVVRAKAGKTR